MAHTAKYLAGALVEIIENNLTTFGVHVINGYDRKGIPQKTLTVGPADRLTARVRIDRHNFNQVNSSAALTQLQVVYYHVDVWGRIDDGINKQDNDAGTITRIWQLISGLVEAANIGDIGWANITACKLLHASEIDYRRLKVPHFTIYCAATWN